MPLLILALPLVAVAQAAAGIPASVDPPREAVVVPRPAPPPFPATGTAAYELDRARRELYLRHECVSEQAIDIIIAHQDKERAPDPAARAEERRIATALTQAAYAEPLDLVRFEAAQRAWRNYSAAQQTARDERTLELMRQLPERDRQIYARQGTPMQVSPPARPCFAAP